MNLSQLLEQFKAPPKGYGEVSFFRWHGDTITKEKLSWILQQLTEHHIEGLQINYCHGDKGGLQYGLTMESDPKPLSDEWWGLVGRFMQECKQHGISISLSDYTRGAPGQGFFVDEVLSQHPEFKGQLLQRDGDTIAPKTVEYTLNPMAKGVGAAIADEFYGDFERHFAGECGSGINYFFSDELNFNIRGNLWCDDFAQEFKERKGYDIAPKLMALFEDIGDETPKIRLDYYDVVVQLSEEGYFKPVYDWHQKRGMIFGCDHGGRGKDITEFGDYFRTMRWNQGPGNDQPRLASDLIKTKVSASIAHLYKRPRVWLEGFYSSGWQTSSADVADATFRNFALGHNLLSLHGLYYSTHGSMWEWAPPCNHYHMPYWSEMDSFLECTERLSYLLAQGVHCCDVAIVYPVADTEADVQRGKESTACAFETAHMLYSNHIDFDFIDFESIANSEIKDKELHISGEKYKIVIIPSMAAVRFCMIEKLAQLAEQGGIVLALGTPPAESDRIGRNDPVLNSLVAKLRCISQADCIDAIKGSFVQDFETDSSNAYFIHRKIGDSELCFLYGIDYGARCSFRATGKPVTAWAVMKLWEQGKLDLLDPVSRYIPSFAQQTVGERRRENTQEMTIHHLLSMTSGLTYGGTDSVTCRETQALFEKIVQKLHTESPMTTMEVAQQLAEIPLAFTPGSHWCYGTSADILGAVVEVAAQKSMRDYLREELFLPLGMADTDFFVPPQKQSRLAGICEAEPNGLRAYTYEHLGISDKLQKSPAFVSGGAGLFSTIDDYARFAQMLMQKGSFEGRRYLTEHTAEYFTKEGQTDDLRRDMIDNFQWMRGYNYGNLMRKCENPYQCAMRSNSEEYGWDGWLGTVFMNDPKTETTFLFMQQVAGSGLNACARRIKNALWQGLPWPRDFAR